MDTDPMPRDGSYYQPTTPVETVKENTAEFKRAEQAMPFIEGVMEWFDDVIEATNRLDAVRIEAKRRNKSVEVMAEAYDVAREIFELKRGEFESLKMTFDK
jgi:hypothetical protein